MGGISAVLRYLLGTPLAQEYRLFLVASHMDGSKAKKLLVAGIGLLRTLALLCSRRIDIVHIHCGDFPSPIRKYFYFQLVRLFRPKIILHLHGALFVEQYALLSSGWKRRIRQFFEAADLVVCLSQSWSKAAGQLFPGATLVVVPNGIPIPKLGPAIQARSDAPVRLCFLGLIGARKGAFDLLSAFKTLLAKGLDLELTMGGNGEADRLLREIAPLGGRVRYAGWITGEAKQQLLRHTDIFVLPSYGEGMPMSILEAMSHGVPIVSTPVGGITELVAEGESGFLVQPGDTAQLAERIYRLATDPDLRRRMGMAARLAVERGHDIEAVARRVAELYRRLCAVRP